MFLAASPDKQTRSLASNVPHSVHRRKNMQKTKTIPKPCEILDRDIQTQMGKLKEGISHPGNEHHQTSLKLAHL